MTSAPTPSPPTLPSEAVSCLRQGRVIDAIKIVRAAHGIQLKEAKDMVDAYVASQPTLKQIMAARQAEAKTQLLRWLVIVACLVAAAYAATLAAESTATLLSPR
jgi:hypothetical protein